MSIDPEVVKWVGGIVGAVIAGSTMVYVGMRAHEARDAKSEHLGRTTALELAQVKYSSHVTAKLDDLIESNRQTVKAISDLSTAVGNVTSSVARIEGVVEGTKLRASE